MVGETTLNQAWSALRVVLRELTFYDIKEVVGLAGVDVTRLAHLEQRAAGGASKGQLITALDGELGQLDETTKSRVLSHIAEEIIERQPGQSELLGRGPWPIGLAVRRRAIDSERVVRRWRAGRVAKCREDRSREGSSSSFVTGTWAGR